MGAVGQMRKLYGNLLVVLFFLLIGILLQARLPVTPAEPSPAAESLASLPYHLGSFAGREAHSPEIVGYRGETHRIYRQPQGVPIELLAFPAPLNVHDPETCLPYLGWTIVSRASGKLAANPVVELETVIAVPPDPSQPPLACGYYWRRNQAASANLAHRWLDVRWASVTRSLDAAELVSLCTTVDDIRHPQPALLRLNALANLLEPYFRPGLSPAPATPAQSPVVSH